MKYFKQIIKLSATPATVFYPLPVIPFLIFSLAEQTNLLVFTKITMLSFLFFAAINLWNHVNDVEEDLLAGKDNIFAENKELRKNTVFLCLFLYIFSFSLVFIWTLSFFGILCFLPVAVLTWMYSDKLFFGKVFVRLKENYITELVTYIFSYPLFTLVLWNLAAPTNLKAIMLSIMMLFFGLWGVFLKDIKDTTGDRLAGLNTLAVKFSPETNLKASLFFLLVFYIVFIGGIFLDLFSRPSIVCLLSILSPLYVIVVSHRSKWTIDSYLIKPLSVLGVSNIFFFVLLSLINLLKF
ncbi:hypothetical protein DRP07_11785 [Archaeoglobales archaeon]|nr:MAG: hypothetical protein DRP07_11785 [Archaeoglobales archaeon]